MTEVRFAKKKISLLEENRMLRELLDCVEFGEDELCYGYGGYDYG